MIQKRLKKVKIILSKMIKEALASYEDGPGIFPKNRYDQGSIFQNQPESIEDIKKMFNQKKKKKKKHVR